MDKKNVEDIYRVGNLQRRFTAKELKICVFEYTLNTSCGPSNLGKKKKKIYTVHGLANLVRPVTKLSISLDNNAFTFFV